MPGRCPHPPYWSALLGIATMAGIACSAQAAEREREIVSEKCDLVKYHCASGCQAAGKGMPSCSGATISELEWLHVEGLWSCVHPMCDFQEPWLAAYAEPTCYEMLDGSHVVWCPRCLGGLCASPATQSMLAVAALLCFGCCCTCLVVQAARIMMTRSSSPPGSPRGSLRSLQVAQSSHLNRRVSMQGSEGSVELSFERPPPSVLSTGDSFERPPPSVLSTGSRGPICSQDSMREMMLQTASASVDFPMVVDESMNRVQPRTF